MVKKYNSVVIYTWSIPKGGLFKVIEKEFEFLTEKLDYLTFVTSEPVPEVYQANFSRIRGVFLSNNNSEYRNQDLSFFFPGLDISIKGGILGSAWRVYAFLSREKPRIILAHQLFSAFLILPYALVYRMKVVIVLHDNPFMFMENGSKKGKGLKNCFLWKLAYRIEKFTLKRSRSVICTTYRIKQSVIEHIGEAANLLVADYGIDTFPRAKKENRDILLTVSKWSRFRKPEKYLEVLKYLPKSIKLTFAGRWDSEKDMSDFINSVNSLNLHGRVNILTNQTDDELSKLYDRTKVFLRLGFNETGTGQAILEAIGHGCPVVISKKLGAAEIVRDGVNGFTVNENIIPEVASRIDDIYSNNGLFDSMSQESYKLAESKDWETYLRKIMIAIQ